MSCYKHLMGSTTVHHSPAQVVKDFAYRHRSGVLSTISQSIEGYPFGSVVPYDLTEEGELVIFISLISEHCRNLQRDTRGSLLVVAEEGREDPQAHARATFVGDFTLVPEDRLEAVSASYWKRFPESTSRALAHDFQFYFCAPKRVRWIGGFGDIRWIDGPEFCRAPIEPTSFLGRGELSEQED